MQVIDFGVDRAVAITQFASQGATSVPLGHGRGEAHVYCVRFDPGGVIGLHPAGFGQLFLVVAGSGWVSGADGVQVPLQDGQGAYISSGEVHAKGSDVGMMALMVQVSDLMPVAEVVREG